MLIVLEKDAVCVTTFNFSEEIESMDLPLMRNKRKGVLFIGNDR